MRTPDKDRPALSRRVQTSLRSISVGRALTAAALIAAVLAIGALAKLVLGGGVVPIFVTLLQGVQDLGVWGVPLLFACEAAAFLLLVPISPLHVGIGFLYGPLRGTLLAWTAYSIGCVPPFLLARVPLLAERFVQLRRRAQILDGVFAAVELEPFKLIVCLRLSPLLPSTLNSYLLGLTNVPLRTYLGASLVGALPNVCAYVYLGTLLESLSDIGAGRSKRTPLTWAIMVTGGVATVGGVAYISRIATRRIHAAKAAFAVGQEHADSGQDDIEPGREPGGVTRVRV